MSQLWRSLIEKPRSELFDQFHSQTAEKLLRYCSAVLRHSEAAMDVVQLSYLRLWSELAAQPVAAQSSDGALQHRVTPPRPHTNAHLGNTGHTALFRFATLEIDRARKEFHRELRRRVEVDLAYDLADPAPPVPEALSSRESFAQIRMALDQLPQDERRLFVMHYEEGLSHQQIADQLGVQRSTITKRLKRAVAKLRAALPPDASLPEALA